LHEEHYELAAGGSVDLRWDWTFIAHDVIVLDPAGEPAPGTFVWALPRTGLDRETTSAPAGDPVPGASAHEGRSAEPSLARTGADGRAQLLFLHAGSYVAFAQNDAGAGKAAFDVRADGVPSEPLVIRLAAPVPCAGVVSVLGATPPPGAWTLHVEPAEGPGPAAAVPVSAPGGVFSADGLPPGEYSAQLSGGERYERVAFTLPARGAHDLVLEFRRAE
jgi:hypothetical protein